MSKATDLVLADVKKFLKHSKSGIKDEGPYSVDKDVGWYNILNKEGTVVGQALIPEWELQCGYKELPSGEIESWEHYTDKRSKHVKRAAPEVIHDTQLEVLITNYLYTYLDKPGAMSIHTTSLLSALLELKKFRAERNKLNKWYHDHKWYTGPKDWT